MLFIAIQYWHSDPLVMLGGFGGVAVMTGKSLIDNGISAFRGALC